MAQSWAASSSSSTWSTALTSWPDRENVARWPNRLSIWWNVAPGIRSASRRHSAGWNMWSPVNATTAVLAALRRVGRAGLAGLGHHVGRVIGQPEVLPEPHDEVVGGGEAELAPHL